MQSQTIKNSFQNLFTAQYEVILAAILGWFSMSRTSAGGIAPGTALAVGGYAQIKYIQQVFRSSHEIFSNAENPAGATEIL